MKKLIKALKIIAFIILIILSSMTMGIGGVAPIIGRYNKKPAPHDQMIELVIEEEQDEEKSDKS